MALDAKSATYSVDTDDSETWSGWDETDDAGTGHLPLRTSEDARAAFLFQIPPVFPCAYLNQQRDR